MESSSALGLNWIISRITMILILAQEKIDQSKIIGCCKSNRNKTKYWHRLEEILE